MLTLVPFHFIVSTIHVLTPIVGRLKTEPTTKKCSMRLVAALIRHDTICNCRNRDRGTERDRDRNTVSHHILRNESVVLEID
jgi:hypothetical protein